MVASKTPTRSAAGRLFRSWLRSPFLIPIWGLEALNFYVHALRPVPWNTVSQAMVSGTRFESAVRCAAL
jgi:hypothetical protein